MNVHLTPQLEAMIRRKIESGLYNDASEVVREALRLMEQRDDNERIRASVAEGFAQVERGEYVEYTPELLERLKCEAEENARLGKPVSDDVKP